MGASGFNNRELYFRLWREIRRYWGQLLILLFLGFLSAPLALLTPLPLKLAVDNVIGTHPLPHLLAVFLPAGMRTSGSAVLALAVCLILLVAILSQLRDFATSVLTAYTSEKLVRGFRAKLFRHVQRLSLSYHDTKGTADSTYRIQYDAAALQNLAVEGILPFIGSAFTLACMIAMTARINWRLALIGLGISPLIFVVSRAFRRRLRRQSREVKKIESSALSIVQEALGAARVVKAFGQEDREEGRFIRCSNEGMRARLGLAWLEGTCGIVVALITAVGMAAVLYVGVQDIRAGRLTLGDLLLVMGYLTQLYAPLKTISKKMASMQSHLAGAERAFALLEEAVDVPQYPQARPLGRSSGAMSFRNASFAYQKDRPILSNISFQITAGTCLGIAGTTGAGKTTLVNLLTRFYDPTAGEILLDGVDLRDYCLRDLRNQFALVLQEPVLFSTTIAENIAYARPDADDTEIIAAARAANAHAFISRLPQGYDTLVGERGMCLSGGERQRVSIARAFLKDAPILILDEPTSSVDLATEAAIVEAMERLMKGRTTFIIAHRLSTLKHCDLILTLQGGRVVEIKPGELALHGRIRVAHGDKLALPAATANA